MKSAIAVFLLLFAVVVLLAAVQGRLEEGLRATARTGLALGPILVLAVVVMGFTEALVPAGWVERWLSDAAGLRGLGTAWLAGLLTPGGSIIGFPLAAGLFRSGASPAVVVTYLCSMATLNLLRLPMEAGTYGWRMTLLRFVACAPLPLAAGALARISAPFFLGR